MSNDQGPAVAPFVIGYWVLVILSSFGLRHSSLPGVVAPFCARRRGAVSSVLPRPGPARSVEQPRGAGGDGRAVAARPRRLAVAPPVRWTARAAKTAAVLLAGSPGGATGWKRGRRVGGAAAG